MHLKNEFSTEFEAVKKIVAVAREQAAQETFGYDARSRTLTLLLSAYIVEGLILGDKREHLANAARMAAAILPAPERDADDPAPLFGEGAQS